MKEETKLHVEEHEKHLLLDHNYDGLQELNHPLPFWWQFTFYGGIIFGAIYLAYYTIGGGPSLRQEFNKDYAFIAAKVEDFKKRESQFDPAVFATYNTPEGIDKGRTVFEVNCIACHLEKGTGDIGPNLTDNFWINSKGSPETNYPVIFNGVVEKGMPIWSEVLSKEEIYQVVAYVQTLHNTFAPNGKAPQGEKVE
ncbi:MAG: c-type cytochrome [Bacteriovoracaceae bacterium]|nr:c-type cytochrome [Bacteriovoracaceae bacterium]